jgi:hypothetical protein
MPVERSSRGGRDARGRAVVACILAVGWILAAFAWVTAPPVVENDDVYDLEHSKKYLRELERIGGKAGLLGNDIDGWLASLWEGRTRAYTIASLTVVVAGAYVLLRRAGGAPPGGDARPG